MNSHWSLRKPTRVLLLVGCLAGGTWFASSCADGESRFGLPVKPAGSGPLSGTVASETNTGAGGSSAGTLGHRDEPALPTALAEWPAGADDSVASTEYALIVSVDGLASRFLLELMAEDRARTFERLGSLGASTRNARTDTTYTNTLPNHTCMLTGLPVTAPLGFPVEQAHGYTFNGNAGTEVTLHNSGNPARDYVPSVFDVAHDQGLKTALFASKTKFSVYENSYNTMGAPDTTGEDNGTKKIDTVEINTDPVALADSVAIKLKSDPAQLTFVHLNQPDLTGHSSSWGGEAYMAAVELMDRQIERMLDAVLTNESMRGHTAVIVTTDHGGTGYSHLGQGDERNFVIPFYLMGPGIKGDTDLYDIATQRYSPPADNNPGYEAAQQPLRNGDAGNLALELLGLPPVPGSLMHTTGIVSISE